MTGNNKKDNLTIGVISLGCDKNRVDTERLLWHIKNAGHEITANPADAEAIFVNTCAFIERARKESIDAILEMAGYKTSGRLKYLLVGGCLYEMYGNELAEGLTEADAFMRPVDYKKIGDFLIQMTNDKGKMTNEDGNQIANYKSTKSSRAEPRDLAEPSLQAEQSEARQAGPHNDITSQFSILNSQLTRILTTPAHYAYLKIAEGCDNRCTYCTIPLIKGRYRSYPMPAILDEARALVDNGIKELILVAQDVTRYGADGSDGAGLIKLLDGLSEIDGVEWLRLMYLYPEAVTPELIRGIAQNPKICKYADIPLQHVSDRVLRTMGRRTDGAAIRRLIENIRAADPDISIRSTFIVGFPGETDAEFSELLDFLGEYKLNNAGFFGYSREDGTPAAKYPDQISVKIIKQRLREAKLLQQSVIAENHKKLIGRTLKTLCDERRGKYSVGRTGFDAPDADTLVYMRGGAEPGNFYDVKITGVKGYDLVGQRIVY